MDYYNWISFYTKKKLNEQFLYEKNFYSKIEA